MREIVWTRSADADFQSLFNSLEDTRPGSGGDLMTLIDSSIETLKEFPGMAPVFVRPIRRLLLPNRRHGIFYAVEGKRIIIHAVADLRANLEDLKIRFRNLTRSD
jgi:plasmid stabilization system protein ParE